MGPQGRVTGLDILPQFVQEATRNIAKWKLGERAKVVEGDIYKPPFAPIVPAKNMGNQNLTYAAQVHIAVR